MKWLLIYTHAYEEAIKKIEGNKRLLVLCDDLPRFCEHINLKIKRLESVLRFIEKRIKLIEL